MTRVTQACRVRHWLIAAAVLAGAAAGAIPSIGTPASAAAPVPLGVASTYAVLGGQAVTDVPPPTGPSTINGDLGVWPGTSLTGAPVVNGATHVGDTAARQAQAALTTAYNFAAGQATTATVSANLGGRTLVAGAYRSPATMALTGTLTLDGQNNPNSVFIFQVGSDLITATDSRINLVRGAQACNVFWQVTSSATLNTRSIFAGSILALQSATLGAGATVAGRVLARNGAVTLIDNSITRPSCVSAIAPPTISKTFADPTVELDGTTSLSFTLTNPNSGTSLTGVQFTDALPAGLTIATPNGFTGSCGGGTITAAAGGSSISLVGATLPNGGTCTFSVDVIGTTPGTKVNTSGPVSSTQTGPGSTASASVTVGAAAVAPPTIAKDFGFFVAILDSGTTSMSFTITNPNAAAALTGVGFTDALPAGLEVAAPNGLTGSCGGGTITAVAGSGSVSLVGATLAAGATCTFSVEVLGTSLGTKVNTTGAVTSNEGGPGATASDSLVVAPVIPPTIAKVFADTTMLVDGTTSLSFTLTNPGLTTVLTGIGFTDALPAGLVIATPNGLTGSCGGGTITAVAGSGTVSLAGATLPASGTCTFSVNVTGTTTGTKVNTSGPVTSTNSGPGTPAAASVTVGAVPTVPPGPGVPGVPPIPAAPAISKAFGASTIAVDGMTTLSFTLINPNIGTALSGIGFTDSLPAGLVIATPNGLTGSCGGGTITATAGGSSISLSGATLPAGGTCTFAVMVRATTKGTKVNATAAVTAVESGPGTTALASLRVTGETLPITGTLTSTFVTTGLAMIGLGVFLLAFGRRPGRRDGDTV